MLKTPELKIGTSIDIVFEDEINKSNAQYMQASVYDYEGDNITISQTSPILSRDFLNRRILVTFVGRAEQRVLRFGISALLVDLISDYQIVASRNTVEALILKQYGKPEPVDFRMHYRIKPPSQSGIRFFFNREKIDLIDISLGGAKFACSESPSFLRGNELKLKMIIDSTEFKLEARVRNVSLPHAFSANKNIQYVSVEFEHNNRQLDAALSKAILAIERQMLSKGKIN
jgi:hypothetical protein